MFSGFGKIEELKKLIDVFCSYPESDVSDIETAKSLTELLCFYESILSCKTLKIIFLNQRGIIQHVNDQMEKWLGYKSLEVEKKSLFKPLFLSSEGSNQFYLHFKEAIEGECVPPFDIPWLNREGEPATGKTFIVPIWQDQVKVLSVLIIVVEVNPDSDEYTDTPLRDMIYNNTVQDRVSTLMATNNDLLTRIEQFRAVENQMRNSLNRIQLYETIINRSSTILFHWKIAPNWPIEFVSENVADFGYTPGDFINGRITWQDFIYSEDLEQVGDRGEEYRRSGQSSYTHEYRIVTKTGDIRWVSDRVEVISDKDGKDLYIQDIITDITESKKMQEELARYRQHLEVLVEKKTDQLKKANDELTKQKEELEHKNLLLTELLNQIEVEKKRIRDDVVFNIEKLLLPTIRHIELESSSVNRNYKEILEGTIRELASSFGRKISDKTYSLSARELEICNMIKNGLSSKEIAELINISPQVVNWHRNNIRKKMGIVNQKINLVSYLKDM